MPQYIEETFTFGQVLEDFDSLSLLKGPEKDILPEAFAAEQTKRRKQHRQNIRDKEKLNESNASTRDENVLAADLQGDAGSLNADFVTTQLEKMRDENDARDQQKYLQKNRKINGGFGRRCENPQN